MSNVSTNNLMTTWKDNRYVGGIEGFLKQNGSTISMVAGFVTLGLCIWRAYKASEDVSGIQKKYASDKAKIEKMDVSVDEKKSKLKAARSERNTKFILAYKFVWLFGGSTLAFMLLSQYLNGIAFTALAGYAMKEEDKVKEFIKKGKEVLGEDKMKEVEDKVLEDKVVSVNKQDLADKLTLTDGEGVLVVDSLTGSIAEFKDMEDLQDGLAGAEKYWSRNHGIGQEKFLQNMGFEYEAVDNNTAKLGWDANNQLITKIGYSRFKKAQVVTIFYTNPAKPMNIKGLNA